jgi:hypothetical protein
MKKSLVLLWLIGLFVLSLVASYLVALHQHPRASTKDLTILVLAAGAGIFVIIGLVCWIVYFVLKRRGHPNRTKIALLVFTGLVACGIAGSFPNGIKGLKKRNQYLHQAEFKQGFIESCVQEGKKNVAALEQEGIKDAETKVEDYCSCVYDKIEANDEIMEMMSDDVMPMEQVMNDKRVIKMATECAMDTFK